MRTAILLPPGCLCSEAQPNSMETVVRTLAAHARSQSAVTLICDADQATAPDPRLLTVPPGLGGRARNRRIKALLETLQPDVVEYHQQLKDYPTQDVVGQVNYPVWHIHGGRPPQECSPVSFSLLLNLVSAADAQEFRRKARLVEVEWMQDMDKRGYNGKQLFETAKALIAKHGKKA